MLTVKLQLGHITKIVEADSVDIYPSGPREKMADEPKDRDASVIELSIGHLTRQNEVFYLGCPNGTTPWDKALAWWGQEQGHWLYDRAYIENQNGKTVEIVQPFG